ncbi:hypothetical protein C8R47DRAFT_1078474 [Mycena vitilis]|nr:hypothetical protein C8R47DRAFT_1078474 [Mycena vitilis]
MAEPAEITGLAFDSSSNRLAVCHRMSVVQVHDMDDKLNPSPVFSVCVNNLLPRALAFAGERQKELIVFNFHDGTMGGGTIPSDWVHGMHSGSVDYNSRRGVFCLDDPFQGTVLYRINDEARVRVFENKLTKPSARPRQVCFGDNCSSVVSGSDHGVVYVHDRRSALRVHPNDWVQTVTAQCILVMASAPSDALGCNVDYVIGRAARRMRCTATHEPRPHEPEPGMSALRHVCAAQRSREIDRKCLGQAGPRMRWTAMQAVWAAQKMVEGEMVYEIWAGEYMAQFEESGGQRRTLHEDAARRMQRAAVAPPLEYPTPSNPHPSVGRMRPADPVFHHGLRPCDAYVVQSHKPPPMRTPQRCAPRLPILPDPTPRSRPPTLPRTRLSDFLIGFVPTPLLLSADPASIVFAPRGISIALRGTVLGIVHQSFGFSGYIKRAVCWRISPYSPSSRSLFIIMVRCPSAPPGMRTHFSLEQPLTPIKIEDYTDDEDDLMYYCENCDPCPVCGSPPIASNPSLLRSQLPPPRKQHRTLTVPLSLPVTIFIVESWIAGDWRHLVLPYLIGIALCYI